jgi:adenylate kinase
LKEVEEKLSIFKTAKIEESKIIVIVSSVMVWSETPKKFEKKEEKLEVDEEEKENPADVTQKSEKIASEDGMEVENRQEEKVEELKQIPLDDSDFQNRVPHQDYVKWKAIEDLALGLAAKENITVYVVCAGILYGNGEHIFEHHFKAAWLESPSQLPYLAPGDNLVPTIHVRDLAKITKFIIDTKPEPKYILAVDNTKDRRQLTLIQSISSGIGTGEVKGSSPTGAPWERYLSINIWLKPSGLLVPEEEGSPPIEWHSLEGIPGNILKLNNEFNEKRGLKPIKIVFSGPPACGKTHFSKVISAEYNIPHIKTKDLLEESIKRHSEFAPLVQKALSNKERIPEEILSEIFRWKLHMNHCRNRGYILDGYPRNFSEAQQLFMKVKKNEEPVVDDEGAEPKQKEFELDSEILPSNIVIFRASTSFLLSRIERIKHLDHEFRHDRMSRRLTTYKEQNEIAEKGVFDYFSDMNNEVFECECNDDEVETIENLKIYIEREGRPMNFLPSVEEMVLKRRIFMQQRDEAKMAQVRKSEASEAQKKEEFSKHRESLARERFEGIRKELQVAARAQAIPLRKYLMDNIMPSLAEALIQVCKVMPEDPVDYVAELMYAHSKLFRNK